MLSSTAKKVIGVLVGLALLVLGTVFCTKLVVDAGWVRDQALLVEHQKLAVKDLNDKIDGLEASYRLAQSQRTADYLRGMEDGRQETQALIDTIRATNSGLWLKVRDADARASSAENAAVQSKRDATKAAQLTAEASEALIRIAADGDAAIKQLGLCQTEYKELYTYTEKLFAAYNKAFTRTK